MASLVGPVQPVSVPVQIERQDAITSSKQVGCGALSAFELQHVDVGNGGIYEPWIYGWGRNIIKDALILSE